mmetsp:Transcript_22179/g.69184  ORF Transcript_22179/g.69184 Transcript_22179/m.69184 type:complete len:430 (+) Transcript_22179:104-1393(+)
MPRGNATPLRKERHRGRGSSRQGPPLPMARARSAEAARRRRRRRRCPRRCLAHPAVASEPGARQATNLPSTKAPVPSPPRRRPRTPRPSGAGWGAPGSQARSRGSASPHRPRPVLLRLPLLHRVRPLAPRDHRPGPPRPRPRPRRRQRCGTRAQSGCPAARLLARQPARWVRSARPRREACRWPQCALPPPCRPWGASSCAAATRVPRPSPRPRLTGAPRRPRVCALSGAGAAPRGFARGTRTPADPRQCSRPPPARPAPALAAMTPCPRPWAQRPSLRHQRRRRAPAQSCRWPGYCHPPRAQRRRLLRGAASPPRSLRGGGALPVRARPLARVPRKVCTSRPAPCARGCRYPPRARSPPAPALRPRRASRPHPPSPHPRRRTPPPPRRRLRPRPLPRRCGERRWNAGVPRVRLRESESSSRLSGRRPS